MYYFLLIYLIINTAVTNSKTIYKIDGKRSTSDPKLSCKNIKCPPMEDPVCVKVTKIDKQKHEEFIMAINKCNMQFMKCHPAGKKHDVTLCGIRKENVLRKIREDSRYDEPKETFKNKNKILIGKEDNEDKHIYDDVEKQPRDIAKANLNDKVEPELSDANDDLGGKDDKEEWPADDNDELGDVNNKEEPLSYEHDDHGVEDNKEMKPAVDIDRSDDEKNEEDLPGDNDNKDSVEDNNAPLGDNKNQKDLPGVKIEEPDDEYKEEDAKEDGTFILQEQEDERDTNIVPLDYDHNTNDNVNSDEYKKNCPTDCPAREVMVCAKCQHNIYRSFLSSCHLRAFSCKHPDEKLELVNRNPCVQSAPFLTNLPSPKGRVSEQSDRDTVLQYIHCRENGKINKVRKLF